MPELIIKYRNKKTLDIIKELARFFEFTVEVPSSKNKNDAVFQINGVTILEANNTIDTSELENIFTNKS